MSIYSGYSDSYILDKASNIEVLGESINLEYSILNEAKQITPEEAKKRVNNEKTPFGKVKTIFLIIGIVVLAVPLAILSPIIIPLYFILDNIKSKMSSKALQKTKRELEKTKSKLENKLSKCKTDNDKAELNKLIKETDNKIKSIEKEIHEADIKKRLDREFKIVDSMTDKKVSEDIDEMSAMIAYNNIDIKSFESILKNNKEELSDYGFFKDETSKDMIEFTKWLLNGLKIKSINDKAVYVFECIDDTIFVYSYNNKTFYYGDYGVGYGEFYTFEKLKDKGNKLLKTEEMQEAMVEKGLKF